MSSSQKKKRGTGERKGGEIQDQLVKVKKCYSRKKSPFCSHLLYWITQDSRIGTTSRENFLIRSRILHGLKVFHHKLPISCKGRGEKNNNHIVRKFSKPLTK